MSTEPKKTKAIIHANQLGCLNEMLQVISMESHERSIYFIPKDKQERKEMMNKRICWEGYQSDHLDYLQIYKTWGEMKNFKDRENWCKQRYIRGGTLRKVERTFWDLQKEIFHMKKKSPEIGELLLETSNNKNNSSVAEKILKCLLASSLISLAKYSGFRHIGYVNMFNGALFHIHISSGQNSYFPQMADKEKEFVIYSKMDNFNGINKARIVSFVKSEWLQDNSLIPKETMERILLNAKENYRFDHMQIELPSWSIKLFRKLFKDQVNQWILEKRDNKNGQSIQLIQPNDTTLCFVYSKELAGEVKTLYAKLKQEMDLNVFNDNIIYNMENTNYTPIIGQGLGVSELLFVGEFITISYNVDGKFNQPQILNLLGLKEEDIHYITVNQQNQQKTTGDLRFFNKKQAVQFLEINKTKTHLKLEPVFPYRKKVAMFDNCKIKATFTLAKPLCSAKITFENSYDVEEVIKRIQAKPVIDGVTVEVKVDQKNPNAFYINKLNPLTDEYTLKNYVMGPLSPPKKISVHREANEAVNMTELLEGETRMIFNSLFTEFLSIDEIQDMYFTFKASKKYKNVTHALITMPSKTTAQKIIEKYDGKEDIYGTQKLRIKIKNSITLNVNPGVFKVMNELIISKITEARKSHPSVKIVNNPRKDISSSKAATAVHKIKITSDDSSMNRQVASKIEAVTRGEGFAISSHNERQSLFSYFMLEYYPTLQKEMDRKRPNAFYIDVNPRSKKLVYYSPYAEVREEAELKIREALKTLKKIEFIDLKNYNIKKVQAYIDHSNKYFPSLQNEKKAFNLTLDYKAKKVFIKADQNFIETFKDNIKGFMVPEANQNEKDCPICLEPLTDDCWILYKCGHKFCKECFINCLESQESTTLVCPIPKCEKILSYPDIRNILSVDNMNKIIENHIQSFVGTQHQSYRNCITPDCSHLFKVGEREYRCEGCFENFCTKDVNDVHGLHPNINCAQFKSKGEEEFQELLKNGEVKMTKCCNIPMIKEDGCNHMTCTQCKGHFCWICLEVFPGADQTYIHMKQVHGGYFSNHSG